MNFMCIAANPESLTNSMFLNNTMHLGLRGRQEHMAMLWGDLEPKTTSDGTIYLEYTERATKTRKGITPDQRKFMPKIFEQRGIFLFTASLVIMHIFIYIYQKWIPIQIINLVFNTFPF